jgi:hypothetical protein
MISDEPAFLEALAEVQGMDYGGQPSRLLRTPTPGSAEETRQRSETSSAPSQPNAPRPTASPELPDATPAVADRAEAGDSLPDRIEADSLVVKQAGMESADYIVSASPLHVP